MPRITKTNHTFKEVFITKYNLGGTILAYDALFNTKSDVMKSILNKPGMAWQKGLLTLDESQLRNRAEQETLRYFNELVGPLATIDIVDAGGMDVQTVVDGGDIKDNILTYLTPSTIMMHGDMIDLAGISIGDDGGNFKALSTKKYPKIISDVLMKKNGINKTVKQFPPALNVQDLGPPQWTPPAVAGPGMQLDSPMGIPVAMQNIMKQGLADFSQLKSDLSILLESSGVSLYTKQMKMPEQKKKKQKKMQLGGMGGIGGGQGIGDFSPLSPEEANEADLFLPEETIAQENIPLSLSFSLLSNLVFDTVNSKKSIGYFKTAPKSNDGVSLLSKLPNQVKSLYVGKGEGSSAKISWPAQGKDIVSSYQDVGLFYYNYELIYKIEILTGFESHNINGPVYIPLNGANIEGYRGKKVMCRMSRYDNAKLTTVATHAKLHLPLVNEYFLLDIDPPAAAAPPAPPLAQENIEELVQELVAAMDIIEPAPPEAQADDVQKVIEEAADGVGADLPQGEPAPQQAAQPKVNWPGFGKPKGGYGV